LTVSEEKATSRDFTGKAIANYPNGDIYDGEWKEGVRIVYNEID
jgi:hypothetical protein